MLHSAVQMVIQTIAEGESLDLKIDMIKNCGLVDQLIAAHNGNEEDICLPGGRRRGYMGYVYDICHMLTMVAADDAALEAVLGAVEGIMI